jgi:hypothetical protein
MSEAQHIADAIADVENWSQWSLCRGHTEIEAALDAALKLIRELEKTE